MNINRVDSLFRKKLGNRNSYIKTNRIRLKTNKGPFPSDLQKHLLKQLKLIQTKMAQRI